MDNGFVRPNSSQLGDAPIKPRPILALTCTCTIVTPVVPLVLVAGYSKLGP